MPSAGIGPSAPRPPTLAVWKLASCDGCQLSLLDCEDELIALVGAVEIASFPEASRAVKPGPYDVSLVEGSVSTPHDRERIAEVRARSRVLVTIGACATAGGIQALRDFACVEEYARLVYPHPEYLRVLDSCTPVSAHVRVDYELRGCPVDKRQLLEVIVATLHGRRPAIAAHALCLDCKLAGVPCVTVTRGLPCLGPVTHAGCGALCPRHHRGCYGCFGPSEAPKPPALSRLFAEKGEADDAIVRAWRAFAAGAPPFAAESRRVAGEEP